MVKMCILLHKLVGCIGCLTVSMPSRGAWIVVGITVTAWHTLTELCHWACGLSLLLENISALVSGLRNWLYMNNWRWWGSVYCCNYWSRVHRMSYFSHANRGAWIVESITVVHNVGSIGKPLYRRTLAVQHKHINFLKLVISWQKVCAISARYLRETPLCFPSFAVRQHTLSCV